MDLKSRLEVLKDDTDFLFHRFAEDMRMGTGAERTDEDEGPATDSVRAPALFRVMARR